MNKQELKEFDEILEKTRGQQNIVGDLIIKDFISKIKAETRQEIIEEINKLSVERYNTKNNPLVSFKDVCDEIKTKIKTLK